MAKSAALHLPSSWPPPVSEPTAGGPAQAEYQIVPGHYRLTISFSRSDNMAVY